MTTLRNDDLERLILRITVGLLMLSHGIDKIINGIAPVISMSEDARFPVWLAYGVYIGEVLAPLLLVVGYYGRIAALVIAFTMVNAIYLANGGDLLAIGEYGAPVIELPLFYLLTAIAIFLLGTGRFSINQR